MELLDETLVMLISDWEETVNCSVGKSELG